MLEKGISCPFPFVSICYNFCILGSWFISLFSPKATFPKSQGYRFHFVGFFSFSTCCWLTLLVLSSLPKLVQCPAQLPSMTFIHKFPPSPIPISVSLPCNHCWAAPKLPAPVLVALPEKMTLFRHMGRSCQPFSMLALLGGQDFWESRVSVWQHWEHKYMQESCGLLIQVLPNPKPAYLVPSHVMLPQVTQLQTQIPHICVLTGPERISDQASPVLTWHQNKWKWNCSLCHAH